MNPVTSVKLVQSLVEFIDPGACGSDGPDGLSAPPFTICGSYPDHNIAEWIAGFDFTTLASNHRKTGIFSSNSASPESTITDTGGIVLSTNGPAIHAPLDGTSVYFSTPPPMYYGHLRYQTTVNAKTNGVYLVLEMAIPYIIPDVDTDCSEPVVFLRGCTGSISAGQSIDSGLPQCALGGCTAQCPMSVVRAIAVMPCMLVNDAGVAEDSWFPGLPFTDMTGFVNAYKAFWLAIYGLSSDTSGFTTTDCNAPTDDPFADDYP